MLEMEKPHSYSISDITAGKEYKANLACVEGALVTDITQCSNIIEQKL